MLTHCAKSKHLSVGQFIAGIAFAMSTTLTYGASTDIGNVPLFTSSTVNVKPNLMFILDDSGSMKSDYIPDEANFSTSKYGKLASQCNGVAYNPKQTYVLPITSAGLTANPGSQSILGMDPNAQLSNKNTLATPSTLTVPTTVDSSITVTIGGLKKNNGGLYSTGDVVTLFSTASTDTFIVGTVLSWSIPNNKSNNTGTLVVKVTSNTGTATLSSGLRVAPGAPTISSYYYTYSGSNTPLSYTYTSSGVITSTSFYLECNSTVGSGTGAAVFHRVDVTTASAEAQNYANWYAYYRTRILMAKSSIGLVFQTLDSKYRVGYTTISDDSVTESTNFLNISDFDATQKGLFFTDLNAASPGSYTPLRGALSKAGQYYAKKFAGQTYDPVQYACQKNFTLLSTDGYWNTQDESSTYGPYGLDGKNVGNLDGSNGYPTARPKYDGGATTVTKKIKWDTTKTVVTQAATTTTSYSNANIATTGTYGTGSGSITTTYSGSILVNTGLSAAGGSCKTSCTVTVTAANHGFSTGDVITIMGSNGNSAFNGSFTITKISTNTFTYSATFSSNSPNSPSNKGYSLKRGSCLAGEGTVTLNKSQVDTYPLALISSTTADIIKTTIYTNNQAVTITPYTETQTIINGAITNDSTAQGTASVTNTSLTPPGNTVVTAVNQSISGPTNSTGTSYVYAAVVATSTACVTSVTPPAVATTSTLVTTKPTYTAANASTTIAATTGNAATSTLSDSGEIAGTATTSSSQVTAGGSTDSLADVAFYYFNNDLRDSTLWSNCTGSLGSDVCGTSESYQKQNMLTMTLGLGASGLLAYDKNYMSQNTAGSGDYYALKTGSKNWPIPANGNGPENIDDLWHAAINGTDFGTVAIPIASPNTQYFSAGDPQSLMNSLTVALANVKAVVGSSSAAATSTLQPVTGDNDVFVAKFTSVQWIGDVQRYSIDPSAGTISSTYTWSAAEQLKNRNLSTNPRSVFYAKSGQSALQNFTYDNLKTDGLNGYFDGFCSKTGAGGNSSPAQCALMTDKTAADTGSNLVAYLIGANDSNYRTRNSRLGDVINGAPLFVGVPHFKYVDSGYLSFSASTRQGYCASTSTAGGTTRQGTIYVGANDGMLHAFDRCDGSEKWAYIPKMVMPNLYTIADNAYGTNHKYFVDGAPTMGDVYDGSNWKTILVGGLNAGGRGYYALDITDPSNPKSLWEFTNSNNANLGLTFGNPIITKRATDGKWVVVFASGYNNINSGDGNGHLIMLDANTGAQILDIPTLATAGGATVGNSGAPSGLAKINAWVEAETDNTAQRYYAGDLQGNVWRFDTENLLAPVNSALRLAQLVVSGTTTQPITTKPELSQISYQGANYVVVYVATGSYLGMSDLSTTGTQTIYGFKDLLGSTPLGDLRASNTLVKQTLTTNGLIRTATKNAVDWDSKGGWMVDLPSSGERVNVDMTQALNVLSVASTIPSSSACDSGGTSWIYKLDIASGAAVSGATDNAAGLLFKEGVLIVGQTIVQLTDGSTSTIYMPSNDETPFTRPDAKADSNMPVHRTSWRELAN